MDTMIEKTMRVGKAAMSASGLAVVLLVGALDASDAKAKKRKVNVVQCVAGQICEGSNER